MTGPPDLGKLLDDIAVGVLRNEVKTAQEVIRPAVAANARRLTAAWAYVSLMLRSAGDSEAADAESARALALWDTALQTGDPGMPTPSEVEAIVLLLVEKAERASDGVALSKSAVEQDSDDPRPHAALGFALSQTGDFRGAEEALIRSSEGWLRMGAADRALIDASMASSLPGAGPRGALMTTRALVAKANAPGARARYDELITEHPEARFPAVEAELDLVERRPEEALAKADAILAERLGDVDALGLRALALRDLGRLSDAMEALEDVIDAGGGDRFRVIRASMLGLTGQDAAALDELDALGPFAAAVPLMVLIRAEVLLHLQQYEEAVAWFDRFLQADPGNPVAMAERVLALFNRDRAVEEAETDMDALLAEPPANPDVAAWMERQAPAQRPSLRAQVLLLRGQLRLGAEKYSLAVSDLRRAAEILGPQPHLTASLAQALVSSGEPEEAISVVDAAPPVVAGTPAVLVSKAVALGLQGRYEEALETITKARDWAPGDPTLRQYRDSILIALERYDEAAASLQEQAVLMPEDADVIALLGSAVDGLGRHEEAIELFVRAEGLGGDPDVYESHVDALRSLGRSGETVEIARNAVERFPEDARAHHLLGSVLAAEGDVEGAIDALQRSLDLKPEQPNVAAELGDALRRSGDYRKALKWLDRALQKDPRSVYALGTRGEVLMAQGNRREGLVQLREAAEIAGDEMPGWLLQELTAALDAEGTQETREEALALLERYLAVGGRDARALAEKAETLRMLDRASEGLEVAEEALVAARQAGKEDGSILATKAQLLVDLHRPQEALDAADAAFAALGDAASAKNFARGARVRALAALNRHAEAMEEVEQYIDADPGDAWGLMTKADLLIDYRSYRDAAAILNAIAPAEPIAEGLIGLCRNRLGNHTGAVPDLESAVAAESQLWWCWAELGLAKLDANDSEGAERAFRTLVNAAESSSVGDSDLLGNAAWAAYRLGEAGVAVGLAHRALAADSSSQEVRLVLGTALLLAGRGLAGLDEIEAVATAAQAMPDPLRGAAILEQAIEDLKRLGREKALDLEMGEASKALDTLGEVAAALRQPARAT